ncbi:hypothetical protein Bca4012_057481 [Brassica carinata]
MSLGIKSGLGLDVPRWGNSGQKWDDLARGGHVENPDQGSNVSGGPAIHQPRSSVPTVESMVRSVQWLHPFLSSLFQAILFSSFYGYGRGCVMVGSKW